MSELLAAFAALPDSVAMLIVFVLAGLFNSCSGWISKVYSLAQGNSVRLDWAKMRNAAITGVVIGIIAWFGTELQIEPFASIEIEDHTDFGLMFTAAFTAIFTVHRFLVGPVAARVGAGKTRSPAGEGGV